MCIWFYSISHLGMALSIADFAGGFGDGDVDVEGGTTI